MISRFIYKTYFKITFIIITRILGKLTRFYTFVHACSVTMKKNKIRYDTTTCFLNNAVYRNLYILRSKNVSGLLTLYKIPNHRISLYPGPFDYHERYYTFIGIVAS